MRYHERGLESTAGSLLAPFSGTILPWFGVLLRDCEARKAAVFLGSDFQREFESISLQRRVTCEPDFLDQAAGRGFDWAAVWAGCVGRHRADWRWPLRIARWCCARQLDLETVRGVASEFAVAVRTVARRRERSASARGWRNEAVASVIHPTEPIPTGIATGGCGATLGASRRLEHRQLRGSRDPVRENTNASSTCPRRFQMRYCANN